MPDRIITQHLKAFLARKAQGHIRNVGQQASHIAYVYIIYIYNIYIYVMPGEQFALDLTIHHAFELLVVLGTEAAPHVLCPMHADLVVEPRWSPRTR